MEGINSAHAPGSDGAPVARTSSRLSGSLAESWFLGVGLVVEESDRSQLQISAEQLVGNQFLSIRIWHTAANLRFSEWTTDTSPRLLLQIDGELIIEIGGSRTCVKPNDVALFTPTPGMSFTCAAPTARIEVAISANLIDPGAGLRVMSAEHPTPAFTALASVLNAMMNAEPESEAPVAAALLRSIHAAIDAVLLERLPRARRVRSSFRLYQEALTFIQTWSHSPTVDVPAVVEAMHVSRQYLTKVFTDRGTTIGGEIRRHRAQLAQSLLTDISVTTSEAAATSGFSSVSSMRRAISLYPISSAGERLNGHDPHLNSGRAPGNQ